MLSGPRGGGGGRRHGGGGHGHGHGWRGGGGGWRGGWRGGWGPGWYAPTSLWVEDGPTCEQMAAAIRESGRDAVVCGRSAWDKSWSGLVSRGVVPYAGPYAGIGDVTCDPTGKATCSAVPAPPAEKHPVASAALNSWWTIGALGLVTVGAYYWWKAGTT